MSDPIFFGLVDGTGAPAPAAAPSWVGGTIYSKLGVARVAPAWVNRGDGQHGFEPSAADEALGCVGLIDAGVGAYFESGSRYAAVTIPEAAAFEAFVLTDADDVLWTGAAPTFQSYEGRAGPLVPQPAILAITAAFFVFVPSSSDIAAGVSFRVDAPAGAFPEFLFGSATAPTQGPYSPPSSGTYPADAVAQTLAGVIALPDPPGGADVTLTYAAGGNLITGPIRPYNEGSVPQLAVFVLQNGGPAPEPYMGQGESWHVTRVQVTVRSEVNAYGAGLASCNGSFQTGAIAFVGQTVQLNTSGSARPTADASSRGKLWYSKSAGGAADTVEVCLKSAADTYSWVTIATG